MTNLTDLLPAGAGGKQVSFTASGTISSGQTVALNSDGTVSAAELLPQTLGSSAVFESAATAGASGDNMSAVYDSVNDKVVVFYRDQGNSNYGTAVVGAISGTSLSFGTPVVYESATVDFVRAAFDSNAGKTTVAFRDGGNSNYGTAIVGTVSGTSISFGSAVVFESANVNIYAVSFNSADNKIVIAYIDYGNNAYGTAIVGTISGTSISFGSPTVFDSVNLYSPPGGAAYDVTNNKVVIAYRDASINSNWGAAIVGTVSGTSISFGSKAYFENGTISGSAGTIAVTYDLTASKVFVAYSDGGNSNYGTAAIGTVSGTSVSFGTPVVFEAGAVVKISAVYDSINNKVNIVYADNSNSSKGTLIVGTVSGTSISFETPVIFNDAATNGEISATFSILSKAVFISYADGGNSSYGTGIVFKNESTNATDFIGIADAAISDTASGNITIKGGVASSGLSGLTPNATYYVQDDGSLGSTSIPYDISSASYDSVNFYVSSQETVPTGVDFSNNGTKMFIVGSAGDDVNEYTLSTSFDVSTATYSQNFSVSAQETAPRGIRFNNDGTKMFIVGYGLVGVAEYALSTAFDVSTASHTHSFSASSQSGIKQGIAFNTDGTKMYIVSSVFGSAGRVDEYALSTAFNVSTASFSQSFSVYSQDTNPQNLSFNSNGTEMYVLGSTNSAVYKYTLSTAFDVSTASYASVSFSVSSQESTPTGLAFGKRGEKMFIIGINNDSVFQYSTSPASTTVTAGKALSTTSINLDYSS